MTFLPKSLMAFILTAAEQKDLRLALVNLLAASNLAWSFYFFFWAASKVVLNRARA